MNINVHSIFSKCFYTLNECPNQNVTFWLYNRTSQHTPIKLDEWNLNPDDFYPKKPLKIIIHGYTENKDSSSISNLRLAFFHNLDVAVISVDYGPLVEEPCYIFAVSNYLVAARCTANLINLIVYAGYFSADDIHVIGFSLGAQVAGAIPPYLTVGKLSRVTGLDPAKPLFLLAKASEKLDQTDAHFVDVIHTDIFVRGMPFAIGHIDFYPNGGIIQPGCFLNGKERLGACNHARAPLYYAESMRKDSLGFWGYECPNTFLYHTGFCHYSSSRHQELMGYYADPSARGLYFLDTNAKSPFAKGRYPRA